MASLEQVFSRLRKVSRACLPAAERVSPEIRRLVTKRRSPSRWCAAGCRAGRGQAAARPCWRGSGLVELGEAGDPGEDPIETPLQRRPAGRVRIAFVELEVSVEPPDQLALQRDQAVLLVCHADDPAEMALGVDPTQGVLENVELTGIIGDDHRVAQQAAGDDGTDHGRLGDPPTLTGAEAEAVQVGLPRRIVGKAPGSGGEQSGDDTFRHAVVDQVGQRRGVDHVVRIAGPEQVEEVQPAL